MEPRPLNHGFTLEYVWRWEWDGTCVRRKKRSNFSRNATDACNELCIYPAFNDMKISGKAGNVDESPIPGSRKVACRHLARAIVPLH